jgi:hypothetical protein
LSQQSEGRTVMESTEGAKRSSDAVVACEDHNEVEAMHNSGLRRSRRSISLRPRAAAGILRSATAGSGIFCFRAYCPRVFKYVKNFAPRVGVLAPPGGVASARPARNIQVNRTRELRTWRLPVIRAAPSASPLLGFRKARLGLSPKS